MNIKKNWDLVNQESFTFAGIVLTAALLEISFHVWLFACAKQTNSLQLV